MQSTTPEVKGGSEAHLPTITSGQVMFMSPGPDPVNWFAEMSGPASWPVTHSGTATFPRRSSPCDQSVVCSACNTALRGRLSSSEEAAGPAGPPDVVVSFPGAPPFRSKASATIARPVGTGARGPCVRRGTGTYVVVGGGLLIIALLGLSLCERGFNSDRGTFESVWPLSHHGVDYEIEIEETWEFRNEVPRLSAGLGSTHRQYLNLTQTLMSIVTHYGVTSMIDCGCSSLSWQPEFLDDVGRAAIPFRYLGLDSSLPVIQANRWRANFSKARRASQSGTCEFKVLDITHEALPQGYDLLFSHDHLEHLPMQAVLDVLEGFMHSNADFLLIDSHINRPPTGSFQGLDQAPFNLGQPMAVFDEQTTAGAQRLLLYPAVVLRALDFNYLRQVFEPLAERQ